MLENKVNSMKKYVRYAVMGFSFAVVPVAYEPAMYFISESAKSQANISNGFDGQEIKMGFDKVDPNKGFVGREIKSGFDQKIIYDGFDGREIKSGFDGQEIKTGFDKVDPNKGFDVYKVNE